MPSRLNHKQVPGQQGGTQSNSVVDETVTFIPMTDTMMTRPHIYMGVPRVPGCYVSKAFSMYNGVSDDSFPATVQADSNSTTAVIKIVLNPNVMEPGMGDRIGVRCLWKSGNNPQGVQATLNVELSSDSSNDS